MISFTISNLSEKEQEFKLFDFNESDQRIKGGDSTLLLEYGVSNPNLTYDQFIERDPSPLLPESEKPAIGTVQENGEF